MKNMKLKKSMEDARQGISGKSNRNNDSKMTNDMNNNERMMKIMEDNDIGR